MNAERLRQIEELYHSAREREPGERSAFLTEACRGDEELRRKVELLLAQDVSNDDAAGGNILDRPASEAAPSLLGQPGNARLAPGMQIGPYKIEALLGAAAKVRRLLRSCLQKDPKQRLQVDQPLNERIPLLNQIGESRPELRSLLEPILAAFDAGSTASVAPRMFARAHRVGMNQRFLGTDRFEVRRQIGAGAFGTVYHVWDRERKVNLAAKVLHSGDPAVLHRFKREFRVAADLRHENLVRLDQLFGEGIQWFYTMELVEGVDFLSHVRPYDEPFAIERLLPAFSQLLQGVGALHSASCLHRDLKPQNVLVTLSGRVVLLDFGLIQEIGNASHFKSVVFAGTPGYMSPEQACQLSLSEASDWYSVGVMLFQALTGELPSRSSAFLLRPSGINTEMPDPRSLNPEIPSELAELCCRLLDSTAERRPKLQDIFDVIKRAQKYQSQNEAKPRRDAPSAYSSSEVFVGRTNEMALLWDAFEETCEGKLRVLLIEGQSGIGKSALVRQFLKNIEAGHAELIVLKGRCREFESVPYKGLDSLIDELAQFLRSLPANRVEALLPRDAFLLPRLFPVLGRVSAIVGAPSRYHTVPDEQELRQRTFTALRELLARIADRQPIVLWLDDLQWSDRDSNAFLAEICVPPNQPSLLLVLTFRSEDVSTNPTLSYLNGTLSTQRMPGMWQHLTLSELGTEESYELIVNLTQGNRSLSAGIKARMVAEGGGHPLFLRQLALDAHDDARLAQENRHQTSLQALLQIRIAELPSFATQLLSFVCISSQPIKPIIAIEIIDDPQADDRERGEAVPLLVDKGLVRVVSYEADSKIEPFHDQIRTAVLGTLTAAQSAGLHLRIARVLAAKPDTEPQVLVTHYLAGKDFIAAHHAAVLAAASAENQLAFDRAAQFYQVAIEYRENAASEADLYTKLADTLAKAGRGRDSSLAYLKAASLDEPNAFEQKLRAADQLMRCGHIDDALHLFDELAIRARIWVPKTPLWVVVGIIAGRISTRLRLFRNRLMPATTPPGREDLERLELLRTGGVVLVSADPLLATFFQIKYIREALRVRAPAHLALALGLEASVRVGPSGKESKQIRDLIKRAHEMAVTSGDANAQGVIILLHAYVAYLSGDIPTVVKSAEQSIAFLREHCTGVSWEITSGYALLFWARCWSGDILQVRELLPQLLKEGAARGDLNVEVSLRLAHPNVYLSADEPDECLAESHRALGRWSKSGFYLQNYLAICAQVETHLYCGRYSDARDALLAVWGSLSRSHILRWHILTTMALSLRGCVALACFLDAPDNLSLRAEVKHYAKRLKRIHTSWGPPMAQTLFAGLAAASNLRQQAIDRLLNAAEGFEKISLHAHAAAARYLCGILKNDAEGTALVKQSTDFFEKNKVKKPESFIRMLIPGDWSLNINRNGRLFSTQQKEG